MINQIAIAKLALLRKKAAVNMQQSAAQAPGAPAPAPAPTTPGSPTAPAPAPTTPGAPAPTVPQPSPTSAGGTAPQNPATEAQANMQVKKEEALSAADQKATTMKRAADVQTKIYDAQMANMKAKDKYRALTEKRKENIAAARDRVNARFPMQQGTV